MKDLIRRCLDWLRTLLAPPGGGRHRACPPRPPRPPRSPREPRTSVTEAVARHRRGYVRTRVLVTGRAMPAPVARRCRWTTDKPAPVDVPLVRPFVIAHEQRERRRALALALDGIDVGPHLIHGVRVGAAR